MYKRQVEGGPFDGPELGGPDEGGPLGGPELGGPEGGPLSLTPLSSSSGIFVGLEVGGPLGGPLEGPGDMAFHIGFG